MRRIALRGGRHSVSLWLRRRGAGHAGGLRPRPRAPEEIRGAGRERRRSAALGRPHAQGLLPPHGERAATTSSSPTPTPRRRARRSITRRSRRRCRRATGKTYGALDAAVQRLRLRRQRSRDPVRGRQRDLALRRRGLELPQGDAGRSAAGRGRRPRRPRRRRRRRGGGRPRRRGRRRRRTGSPLAGRHEGSADLELQHHACATPATKKNEIALSTDGSEGNAYEFGSIVWSPDSKKIAANRVRPGYRREVHYVESSPADQLQPKHTVNVYAKPGDALALPQPVIFDVASKKQLRDRQRALPQSLRSLALPVAQGQPRRHLRVQPARPPGLPRHRGGRGHRQGARGHLGGAEDLLQLPHRQRQPRRLRQEVPLRPRGRQGSDLDVGARRLEPPLPAWTAPPARVKHQITKGDWVVRGGDQGGRGREADPLQRRRHERRQGSVLPQLLPDQLRRHRPDAADHRRRQPQRRLLRRRHALRRHAGRASTCRRSPSCTRPATRPS